MMKKELKELIKKIESVIGISKDKLVTIEAIRDTLHRLSPQSSQPVDRVRWVPIDEVQPNDYNPNVVAPREMKLLYVSIKHDGYTQPIVVIWDPVRKKYIIVDGFHRYFVCKSKKDISEGTNNLIPVVVLDKPLNERIASTIRHNRARGEHCIEGMSKVVFDLLDTGWEDPDICNYIGLDPEELLKLKHITGFSALFKDVKYSKAWETRRMIHLRMKHKGT